MTDQDTDPTPGLVLGHVYVGSRAHARDRELLRRLGITHVLNVTPTRTADAVAGVPNFFEKERGGDGAQALVYRRCPIYDNKAEDIGGVLEGSVAFIESARFYGRILVHCKQGVSRSVTMVIAYLIKHHGLDYDAALARVRTARPVAQPNPGFERQLRDYAERIRRQTQRRRESTRNSATRTTIQQRPSIGPTALPPPPSSTTTHETAATTTSTPEADAIGPQLPPHLQKAPTEQQKREKEPSSPTVSTVIGPALPPSMVVTNKRPRDESRDEIHSPPPMTTAVIGPRLPPSKRPRQDE